MGIWQVSDGAKRVSRIISDDFEGSPYAVPNYEINRELGGRSEFNRLVTRAHDARLTVIVDFVSNHVAIDSPWIFRHPEFFVRSDPKARKQLTSEFFFHRSGEVIAFGRDPYFPPWNDTAQLDYSSAALRSQMIDVLKRIGRFADGVRCDMAMLVLRDCFRQLWYPLEAISSFDARMPREFWDDAITEVKKSSPSFKFIAESYWDKEEYLHQLGFDLCYEKKLYDALVAKDLSRVLERLQRSSDALKGSLHFIENHDEPRAASTFDRSSNLAALALILSIPGSVLIHEGQMEGKQERVPVQRTKPLTDEPVDTFLRNAYERLLRVTNDEVFKAGDFHLFDPRVYGALGIIRSNGQRVVAYLAQVSDAWHRFYGPPMNVSGIAHEVGALSQLRLTNLLNSISVTVQANDGAFHIEMSRLGLDDEAKFCLLEASPA